MSDKSPLFVSSLELIAHSTELFAQKNPKKYKFIILHLANSVELILKDCVIDQGISIYDKPGITINIWECIKKLKDKGIDISELPVIELLIDDRNTIQHRFGHPSAESTYYYIEQVVFFFQRFLLKNYNVHLREVLRPHLTEEHLKLLGLVKDDFSYLDKLATVSIESSILQAFNKIEHELRSYMPDYPYGASKSFLGRPWYQAAYLLDAFLDDLRQKGYIKRDMREGFKILQKARNFAAHNPENATAIDWQEAFDIAKELLAGLQNATKSGYTFEPNEELLASLQKIEQKNALLVLTEVLHNTSEATKPDLEDDSSKEA